MGNEFDEKQSAPSEAPIRNDENNEYLTEEQAARFRRISKRLTYLISGCFVSMVGVLVCSLIGQFRKTQTPAESGIGVLGYIGIGFAIITAGMVALLVREALIIRKFYHELDDSDEKKSL